MFQFPSLPLHILWIQICATQYYLHEVSPFGHPRFKACRQLPVAYRSQLRPSSVSYVKASFICAWVTFYVHAFVSRQFKPGKARLHLPLPAHNFVNSCGTPSEYLHTPQSVPRCFLVLHPATKPCSRKYLSIFAVWSCKLTSYWFSPIVPAIFRYFSLNLSFA
jgi:hypothetical protein